MTRKDYHIHTNFCDGRNSPEELVLAAIGRGMTEIGILTHSYTLFDESYCIKRERIGEFQGVIAELKEKYRDKLRILCGVEQDFYSEEPTDGFDYVIGSVHYLKVSDQYLPLDESPLRFRQIADAYFAGDYYALAEKYYETVGQVAEKLHPDIIGHFDLITKFNEGGALFSEADCRYVKSWRNAADRLLRSKIPFEINTGAISRGYRTTPYPSAEIRQYLRENGGSFVLSSDTHTDCPGVLEDM